MKKKNCFNPKEIQSTMVLDHNPRQRRQKLICEKLCKYTESISSIKDIVPIEILIYPPINQFLII